MFEKLRRWSIAIIVIGIVLLLYGIFLYLPVSYESENELWYLAAKRVAIPISGITLIIVGALNVKLAGLLLDEVSLLKFELNKLRQSKMSSSEANSSHRKG